MAKISAAAVNMKEAGEKITSRGTFNAAAAQGLAVGSSTIAERTARAAEATATNTRKIEKKTEPKAFT